MSYSKYIRAFGITYTELMKMPRLEFSKKYGNKFRYMTASKFKKTVEQIAREFEKGNEKLKEYR